MGAFIIFDISFKTTKDREKFEDMYTFDILVDQKSDSKGFAAWVSNRNPDVDVVYYMGFMGYGEPEEMLKDCLKHKINIKFWAWLPINDRQAEWTKIRGKW